MAYFLITQHEFRYRVNAVWSAWTACTTGTGGNSVDLGGGQYRILLPDENIAAGDVEVRVIGGNPSGVMVSIGAFTKSPTPTFNFYVASTGNDTNDGTTTSTPIFSLAKLKEKVTAFGAGAKAQFMDVRTFFASLTFAEVNLLIDGGFNVLDGTEVIAKNAALWTQPDAVTYPNVWMLTDWAVDCFRESLAVRKNGTLMTVRTTLATLNSNLGSTYYPSSQINQYPEVVANPNIDVYISTSTNPNTDSDEYRVAKRRYGITASNGATIKKIVARSVLDNDGSGVFGTGVLIQQSLFKEGGKHNVFIGSGAMEDCICWEAAHITTAGPFIAYQNNPAGSNLRWTRCFVIMPVYRAINVSGFFAHGDGGAGHEFQDWTIEECIIAGAGAGDIGGVNGLGVGVFRNNYNNGRQLDKLWKNVTHERCIWNPTSTNNSAVHGGGSPVVRNCVFHMGTSRSVIFQMGGAGSVSLTLDKCTFGGAQSAYFCDPQSSPTGFAYNITKCLFIAKNSGSYDIKTGQTYTGNYNVYYGNGNKIVMNFGGATRDGLAAFQAATGQDSQSVYLTDTQRASFFLNGAAGELLGDFRVNPNAQVTAGNGTVYTGTFPDGTPLSSAGQQEHWNYATRSIVAGPIQKFPTPPMTEAEVLSYVQNPTSWVFYP